ncbi:RING-H2 finger protein ATL46-like [Arachis hypogaea]|uniref:RING-type E3 ubiquitin transferase n=1 Tax=Arachis hypogaea TaxID=3818 RepID=A0A445AUM8_ARAHY|nr:RING-H2 finger protein ATL47-like [Arachis hypogaea]QHO20359.1 RING-H2 finger protein [Arachis hypogaea]RYR30086.1 hypothetical protein Ahy_B01g054915 [Arachis hypogaea]
MRGISYLNNKYSSPSPFQSHSYDDNNMPPSSSVISRISPLILLVIIVLAVIFFAYGLVHLILWFFIKILSSSSSSFLSPSTLYNSNRFQESSRRSRAIQRQLHHLFRMHDSGLEQSTIDALPVFYYQELLGMKEPFDCAVCLCEFSANEKLRLVPICSHAFHMNCLDTWLLSNSTCPLCRANLSSSIVNQNPVLLRVVEEENKNGGEGSEEEDEGGGGRKRVFCVRLGKLRNSELIQREEGSSSSSRIGLDGRRCYSMGSYEYVVRESNLKVEVVLSSQSLHVGGEEQEEENDDGKKIGKKRTRGESFSVSKIWLWSNKIKYNNHRSNNADADFPLSPMLGFG